jgi:hypothetical protein
MKIPSRSKFQQSIKLCSLFFKKRKALLYNGEFFRKKIDSSLCFKHFETDLNTIFMEEIFHLFEFEMIVLPAFKPKIEAIFIKIFEKVKFEFTDNLQIFFLKKSIIFCSGSLPVFKREKPLQCEIFKFEFGSKNFLKADKICLKEFFEKKNFFRTNNLFQTQKYNLKSEIKQIFLSNGFMEFDNYTSNQKNTTSIELSLINKSLIRINQGPEYRFNFRF